MTGARSLVFGAALLASLPAGAMGQAADSLVPGTSVTISPGPQYKAGWLHRVFFGDHHRDLWATAIEVEVLDLATFGGGLTPLRRGGGLQTKSLRFQGGDGQQYVFRSVDKDPSAALPPSLRETLVDRIVQDQISASHPTGALVVAPLLEAAGVLHAEPRLVIMPDDPRLGDYAAEFAGVLGTVEVRPTEGDDDELGFAGAERVVGSEELFDRLERGPRNRVDTRSFLTARLLDVYLGDWDRHQDQWRWARFGDGPFSWEPIPRDRDQAFARLDGFLLWLARFNQPQLVGFGEDYPRLYNVTWNARDLDRRLLVDLERPVWDSIAVALQSRLSDSVIHSAVARLPAAHRRLAGDQLTRALQRRRDKLRAAAAAFYELLAEYVDIHATDADELIEVTRNAGGFVDVRIAEVDEEAESERTVPGAYYRRRFDRRETREIRLYLHGGDDRVVIRGAADYSIAVRIVGGGGDDTMIDSSRVGGSGRTFFYDDRGDNVFVTGRSTSVDRREPSPRPPAEGFAPPPPAGLSPPPPDWGQLWLPLPWTYYDTDVGLFFGGGVLFRKFAFRKAPHLYAVRFRAGYTTSEQTGRVELTLEVPDVVGRANGEFATRFSGIDVIRFHGLGNETGAELDEDFYKVEQKQLSFRPTLTIPVAKQFRVSLGPEFKLTRTTLEGGTLIDSVRPYGIDTFRQLGGHIALEFDARDRPAAPTRGVLVRASGTLYPAALTVDSVFGSVSGELATYLTADIPSEPTLALRVGGQKVWGPYPFFEAAYIGGSSTVRGFRKQRFGGDAALYGNAELRLYLARVFFLLPSQFGIFGLGDVGRVFLAGESSDTWHTSVGGGIWLAPLQRANTLSLALARSDEELHLYVRAGFLF